MFMTKEAKEDWTICKTKEDAKFRISAGSPE